MPCLLCDPCLFQIFCSMIVTSIKAITLTNVLWNTLESCWIILVYSPMPYFFFSAGAVRVGPAQSNCLGSPVMIGRDLGYTCANFRSNMSALYA